MVTNAKTGLGNGRKSSAVRALSTSELEEAAFADLIEHFNWATDRRKPDVIALTNSRRYLYRSLRPIDPSYQEAVAKEMVRRIKSKRVPGEYSRLFSLELLTAMDQESPVALQLAANLSSRMRSFSEAHHAFDYCTGYWHSEPKLEAILIDRLRALANTEEERDLVERFAS